MNDDDRVNDDDRIVLHLSLPQVNTVLAALGERPFKEVFQLIEDIRRQAAEQVAPPAVRSPEKRSG